MDTLNLDEYLRFLPNVQQSPEKSVWLTYDDDIILRYEEDDLIGFTVLHVSQR